MWSADQGVLNNGWCCFYRLIVCGLIFLGTALDLQAENRVTNDAGRYSFSVPDGYRFTPAENGTGMKLQKENVLSAQAPLIEMIITAQDVALNQYEQLLNQLKRARYSKNAGMRLLKKSSLKTSRGIPGWELHYLKTDKSGTRSVNLLILLDRDTEHMLQITGSALYDSRDDFAITCDQLLNSLEYAP